MSGKMLTKSIQRVQNRALRMATGCHSITPVDHLHQECQTAYVADHLSMLSAQFLASSLRTSHPSHAIVTAPSGPRAMKRTLFSSHISTVEPFLSDGVTDPATYNDALKAIHTQSAQNTINSLGSNPVLGEKPPAVAASERRLPRSHRTTLAQLRSGFCQSLNDYLMRVGRSQTALCPECLIRRHTVRHLFECDARPTTLTVLDLWNNPGATTSFLQTLPSFSHLLPPDPPLDPPPPKPPPRLS